VQAKHAAADELKGRIFLLLAACIVGFDISLILAQKWRWLFTAPVAVCLVTLSMLYMMYRRQQKSRAALLSKIAKLGEEMEAEREQYAQRFAARNRESPLSPPPGHDPSLN
jgi:membrane protein implicated in regulation of membrane protease activity